MGTAFGALLVEPAAVGHVDFTADDGFDAGLFAGRVEVDDSVERPVIGDCQGVHAQIAGPGNQFRDTTDPVEHAVFGVNVEMGK